MNNGLSSAQITPVERTRWILFAILLSITAARVSNIDEPFGRTYEGTVCGPIVCAARNMVRYGLIKTRFSYVENCDWIPAERFTFYNHHPALVPLTMAGGAWLFGDEPWSYRLPAAICSVLTTALLFIMISRKFDWPAGLVAAVIYGFCPFSWLLGDMPDVVGPHLVFFGLATIECYSRWFDLKNRRWFALALGSWLLAAFSDWPAFLLPPVLAVHYLINTPVRFWWRVLPFAFFSAAVLTLHFFWLTLSGDKSVYSQFFHRINGATDNGRSIGILDYWNDAIKGYVFRTFTLPVVGLVGVYSVSLAAIAVQQIRRLKAHDTTLIMLVWGVAHVLIGFQSSHQHMWVWSVVLPGFAAAAALGGYALFNLPGRSITNSWPARGVLAIMACAFILSSYLKAHAINDATLTEQPIIYSLRDLGLMIRELVPSGQGVLTSDMTDESTQQSEPALWYYADRQIRNNIRSVAQLNASLGAGDYPLYYHLTQHGGPEPLWFVMPAEHREELPDLTRELDRRYAHWFIKGYMLYYLKETPTEQAAKERK